MSTPPAFRQLSLFGDLPPVGRPNPDADALKCRAGVEYHEIAVRTILNRSARHDLPFAWSINPYRGCEFGCTYCYARYTHEFLELERWQDFETRIFVKQGAAQSLRSHLRRASLRGEGIAIGTATDPYQPAEHRWRVTRGLLEVLRDYEGLSFSITTKSPIVLRDLDLLQELHERHDVSVNVSCICANDDLGRKLEPQAPMPSARLRTVGKLVAAGIDTHIFCMPILPGINDSRDVLRPLFEAAHAVGCRDIHASALFLRSSAKARFLPWLKQEFPSLVPMYDELFGQRDYLDERARSRALQPFESLRRQYGMQHPRRSRRDKHEALMHRKL